MGESARLIEHAADALAAETTDVAQNHDTDRENQLSSEEISKLADITGLDPTLVTEVITDYRITPKDLVFLGSAMRAAIEASHQNPGVYNPVLEDSILSKRAA